MSRILIFTYGVICYAIFLGVFVYAIGFLGNIIVPNSMDAAPRAPVGIAIVINLGLLGLFAVQHSVMARPAFKRWWTRIVPEPAERSTYVLFSNLAMIALFVFWQPITAGLCWEVEAPVFRYLIYGFYFAGWAVLFYATCLVSHFDLFGLRQVWLHLRGVPYSPPGFRNPGLYKHVRHPIYVGWLMIFWFTPVMTAAHMIFALATTAYILIAIQLEEKDLVDELGDEYRDYRDQTPMLVPSFKPNELKANPQT